MKRRFSAIAQEIATYQALTNGKRLEHEYVSEICSFGGRSCIVVCASDLDVRKIAGDCAQRVNSSAKCIFSEKEARIVFPSGNTARFVSLTSFCVHKLKGIGDPLIIDTAASVLLLRNLLIEGDSGISFRRVDFTESLMSRFYAILLVAIILFTSLISFSLALAREHRLVQCESGIDRKSSGSD